MHIQYEKKKKKKKIKKKMKKKPIKIKKPLFSKFLMVKK